MEEEQIKIFADSLWDYMLEKKLKQYLSDSVCYYMATVTEAASGGTIKVQRPYDKEVTLPCGANAEGLSVGDTCTVLVFGDFSNQIVIGDISKLQEKLTFDATPTDGSLNPVTSDGIFDAISAADANIGIVENGTTATHNISKGEYVVWHGALYTANSNISIGTTLSASNLTAVSGGGLNDLASDTETLVTQTSQYLKSTTVNPNLLDNWYFVGGGSQQGVGQFPINQRGQTSYTGAWKTYGIDRWWFTGNTAPMTIESDGILFAGTSATQVRQTISISAFQKPLTMTWSAIVKTDAEFSFYVGCVTNSNTENANAKYYANAARTIAAGSWQLIYATFTIPTTDTNNYLSFFVQPVTSGTASPAHNLRLKAAKIELGTMQTLAHQENGTWVLNEIPDYEEQLIRCKSSTVDSSDAYANNAVAFMSDVSNRNLLCNTYFGGQGSQAGAGNFPINTRGNLSYSSGQYTIDRWYLYNSGYVRVNYSTYHTLRLESSTSAAAVLRQAIPIDGLKGKTVTFSMYNQITNYGDENMNATIGVGNDATGGASSVLASAHIDRVTVVTATIPADTPYNYVVVYIYLPGRASTGNAIHPRACKLELGDQQTLGYWNGTDFVLYDALPDYEEELVRCRTNLSDPSDTYANDSVAFESGLDNQPVTDLGSFSTLAALSTLLDTQLGVMTNGTVSRIKVLASAAVGPFYNGAAYVGELNKVGTQYSSAILYPIGLTSTILCRKNNPNWSYEALVTSDAITYMGNMWAGSNYAASPSGTLTVPLHSRRVMSSLSGILSLVTYATSPPKTSMFQLLISSGYSSRISTIVDTNNFSPSVSLNADGDTLTITFSSSLSYMQANVFYSL